MATKESWNEPLVKSFHHDESFPSTSQFGHYLDTTIYTNIDEHYILWLGYGIIWSLVWFYLLQFISIQADTCHFEPRTCIVSSHHLIRLDVDKFWPAGVQSNTI